MNQASMIECCNFSKSVYSDASKAGFGGYEVSTVNGIAHGQWTAEEWTVPQLSIMIIYNSTWSILIQLIRIILSGDNLT